MARCRIYQLVDSGKQIAIFWTGFIQIYEVYTHPSFFASFLHQYNIDQPIRIVDFSNEPCIDQLLYFLDDSFLSIQDETPYLLLYQPICKIHI